MNILNGKKSFILFILIPILTTFIFFGTAKAACNADFTADKTSGCKPLVVEFTDKSEDATYWSWSFPGGTPANATGQGPHVVTYYNAGTFDVILDIECTGAADVEYKQGYITVEDCGCAANFKASPRSGCAPLTVKFEDMSSDAVSWAWSFSGGTPDAATGMGPHIVTYNNPGVYNVKLSIQCRQGTDEQVKNKYISVDNCNVLDFGDVPDPTFPTLLASNGARHYIDTTLYLGKGVDPEPDGQPDPAAFGDDNDGNDDEDGVVLPASIIIGRPVDLVFTASDSGFLNAWFDFNQDGDWKDSNEQPINNLLINKMFTQTIPVPASALPGQTYARFRFSRKDSLPFDGPAPDGEVEDYVVNLERGDAEGDLGDAPDGSNSFGANMTAYPPGGPPGALAMYPTVFQAGSPPHGPFHHQPYADAWLGPKVTMENEADQPPDEDGVTNIDPKSDKPDRDGADDGLIPGSLNLNHCAASDFMVEINIVGGFATRYLNVWFDWNRDGDWNDILECEDGSVLYEWSVQDQPLVYGNDHIIFMTKPFRAYHPEQPVWMRMTLAEQKAPLVPGAKIADGRGPVNGYKYGETEDYFIEGAGPKDIDWGDAPDSLLFPLYPTLRANNGASHYINPKFFLGQNIDADPDGQPVPWGLGDDNDGNDDEDGVVLPVSLTMGNSYVLTVTAYGTGLAFLNAWIDFNKDWDWKDAGEHVVVDAPVFSTVTATIPMPTVVTPTLTVPANAIPGKTFARIRYSTQKGLADDGPAPDGEVEDYEVNIIKEGKYPLKWSQPPLRNPESPFPDCFWGWDEPSLYEHQIVADDWLCSDKRPVSDIHWWGSYLNWDSEIPPPGAPVRFHIGIWKDVPAGADLPWSHPGAMIWEWMVDRSALNERPAGCDFYPRDMKKPETCFKYDLFLPPNASFYQPGDSSVFWISISALYEKPPEDFVWGWKTREHYFNDNAVVIFAPAAPVIGDVFMEGHPIGEIWDMAFELTSEEFGENIDFGDAPDPTYPTLLLNNGARHVIKQGFHLGAGVDPEPNGQPDPDAEGDDNDGIDDEDGVKFITALQPGQPATVEVKASVKGVLNAWIDFDANGDWAGPAEHIIAAQPVSTGTNTFNINVPLSAHPGETFTRFRFSSVRSLGFDGFAPDGEVEDYKVKIGEEKEPKADLGDAPDGSNNFPPLPMTAYPAGGPPGILAHYPTVYLTGSPPFGPIHRLPRDIAFLGKHVTLENEADVGPDEDPTNNIEPRTDTPDLDIADDGVKMPLLLANCVNNTFNYEITVVNITTKTLYVNAWFDWNRDGDWTDILTCPDGNNVPEWAVQNQVITLSAPGVYNYNTPAFLAWHPVTSGVTPPIWMRITLSERPWDWMDVNGVIIPGGSGPADGYQFGETEDYYFIPLISEKDYDYGDAPDPTFPTLHANSGAYHSIVPGVHLGPSVDPEANGLQSLNAVGDDNNGIDDEDGVILTSTPYPGGPVGVDVIASINGILNAWVDFNADGDWEEADEHVFNNKALSAGVNSLVINIPPTTPVAKIYSRFRFNRNGGLSFKGYAPDGEVEDYAILIKKKEDGGEGPFKWSQRPLLNPDSPHPECYFGWDEPSIITEKIVADDWFCNDPRPLTGIQWWGSYAEWDSSKPPPNAPPKFHIGVWKDVPAGEDSPFSHPAMLIKEWIVNRSSLHERVNRGDFFPDRMEKPDSTFKYTFNIPPEDWFFQEPDSTIFWLSISAIYNTLPDSCVWGWKTRDHYFNDDAVSIFKPATPDSGDVYEIGEPLPYLWDMAFELFTIEPAENYDFGDAPDPSYPTFLVSNGAYHIIEPGVFLGHKVDADPDGQPDPDAKGDDNDGSNDDDGVAFLTPLKAGEQAKIQVTASVDGILNLWIDYNADGIWDGPEEHVFIDEWLTAGTNDMAFNVPDFAVSKNNFARFRFSTLSPRSYKGLAIDGEVEDYRVDIIESGVKQKDNKIPTEFALLNNYPNPFNPTTVICYQIPKTVPVKLTIYNLLGNEVRVLADDIHEPGEYKAVWDGIDKYGRKVSTGIYIYYIKAGEFTQAKKLLLIK